jgi:adenine-specific DNA-methyltransferase
MTTKDPYFREQILTYMGNKRKFIEPMTQILDVLSQRLNKKKGELKIAEGFSGSGILARLFKTYANVLHVNDIAGYSKTLNLCYLANITKKDEEKIHWLIDEVNDFVENNTTESFEPFISKHWSCPDNELTKESRLYFTYENALRIDKYMHFIKKHVHKSVQHYLLAPLLVECSIHNNTNGQFSAFYKDVDGIGRLGGKKDIDLNRIAKKIKIPYPHLKKTKCRNIISQKDTNDWVKTLPETDIMYFDPPYNKHPYCIYYFLIDIINKWDTNIEVPDTNRGQPKNWNKSLYNSFSKAEKTFRDLIEHANASFIVLSYNNGGIIPIDTLDSILSEYGEVEKIPIDHKIYNKLKGIASYKRKGENKKVNEYLWILDKRVYNKI